MADRAAVPVSEHLLHLSLRSLAEDMLEADTTLHERIDLLSARLQSLLAYIASPEKRIALLEGTPDCTDLPSDFLHELD